jgi:hypothetical protein
VHGPERFKRCAFLVGVVNVGGTGSLRGNQGQQNKMQHSSATVKRIKAKPENRYFYYHGLLMEKLDGLGDMGLL